MNIIHHARELQPGARVVCAAIGVFDGVHMGHQQVIGRMLQDARSLNGMSVVITFDCHPRMVVTPDRAPSLIYSLPKRLRVLEALGADCALVLHFDQAFREQSGEVFIQGLARDFGRLRSISVGSAFTFGFQRSGNLSLLKTLGRQLGFEVYGLDAVVLGGKTISSSRIRAAIHAGQLDLAGQMLGRPYTLAAKVVKGDQIGRQLGFPTANLQIANLELPPHGVYAVQALLKGRTHPAVLNMGCRPTLPHPVPQLQVEAHLLDFNGDLYDTELEIQFVRKLRSEQKFSSPAALQDQIRLDIAQARACLASPSLGGTS